MIARHPVAVSAAMPSSYRVIGRRDAQLESML
jgi:hypothetical protein